LDGGTAGTNVLVGSGLLTFNTTGDLDTPVTLTTISGALDWANGADQTQQVAFDMQTTQYASDFVVSSQSQDGYSAGILVSLDIDNEGIVYGKYSNGEPRALAQIALSSFNNPSGLTKKGSNMWAATNDSGPPIIGTVGSGVGKLFTNSLEQSNVDLAQEFVRMITVQRGFQANSKIITTTDEMMNELINLKR
jgi:flagellar hook protein FlgE